jgi:hypothetical protein
LSSCPYLPALPQKNGYSVSPELVNRCYPVRGARFYPNGTLEVLRGRRIPVKLRDNLRRGEITKFTRKSRARLALVAAETRVEFVSFMTLTYGQNYPLNGKGVKSALRIFIKRLQSWLGPYDYLWWLEFQERDAPHIHMATNLEPPNHFWQREYFARYWVDEALNTQGWDYSRLRDKKLLNERVVMLWFHSRPQQWEAVRSRDGIARYCLKYACKPEQKLVPPQFRDVGRFWGHSKRVGEFYGTEVLIREPDLRNIIARNRPKVSEYDILPRVIFGGVK